jgi:sugar phosphate isomerase/epimerase
MKRIVLCDHGDIKKTSKLCKENNLGVNVDGFCMPDSYEKDATAINEIIEAYKDIGIYSIHGPFCDLCFGSSDKLIQKTTAERFEYGYKILCALQCKNIILHNGYVPGTSFPQEWIKRGKIFWEDFLRNKDTETNFFIENYLEEKPEIITDLINTVNVNNLKICLDIGHLNIHSKIEITKWIENANENIGFVHLHNNYGENDDHHGLNNGKINMKEICGALEQYCPNAVWAIETVELESSIEWLRKNGYIG